MNEGAALDTDRNLRSTRHAFIPGRVLPCGALPDMAGPSVKIEEGQPQQEPPSQENKLPSLQNGNECIKSIAKKERQDKWKTWISLINMI